MLIALVMMSLAACSTNPELGNGGGNVASGSAAGSATTNANSQLEHCGATLGTLVINEDTAAPWYGYLAQYQLPSTVPLLRLIVQQSNCFVLVDRGPAMGHIMGERDLAAAGELRTTSNFHKNQMVAADYTMVPSVNFSQQGGSGISGAAGYVPVVGGLLSTVAGNMHSNEASTTLLLVDNRSTVQLSASQGSAKNWDVGGFAGLFNYRGGGGVGGYSTTPEGKIITAAFMDSYNQMVDSLRNYKAQNVNGGLGAGGNLPVQQ